MRAPNDFSYLLAAEPNKDWLKWAPKIPIKSTESGMEPRSKQGLLNDLIKP